MVIRFIKCPIGLGYAYKKGAVAASLPDADCKKLIDAGLAEDITPKPKKAVVRTTTMQKKDVQKTTVKRKK